MLTAIGKVLTAQGAQVAGDDLEQFVQIRTWPARCFEFAHFTDPELAKALRSIHDTCGGLQEHELEAHIADIRSRGLDIKKVWNQSWSRQPAKPKLAEALWPTLRDKIDNARWDDSLVMPPVADVVYEAHGLAGESKLGSVRGARRWRCLSSPANRCGTGLANNMIRTGPQ